MEVPMITKKYAKDEKKCDVTFELPAEIDSEEAYLCGDFTDWAGEKMNRQKDGSFTLKLTLLAQQNYQFRYRLDGERWENDDNADGHIPNPFGTEDSVLQL
jgi:1,4-alpha-glucan branching enzyme